MVDLDKINKQGVSLIISARNEAKTLPLTVGHLFEEMYTTGITKGEDTFCGSKLSMGKTLQKMDARTGNFRYQKKCTRTGYIWRYTKLSPT